MEQVEIQVSNQKDDIDRLNSFFNTDQIKNDLHWFTHRDTLKRAYNRDDRQLSYIEDKKQIIGAAMVWCESRVLGANEAQIRQIAVSPDYRRKGLATRLCTHAETFAADYGNERMIADVDESSPAVHFWQALDYEASQTWTTDNDRKMIRMVKLF